MKFKLVAMFLLFMFGCVANASVISYQSDQPTYDTNDIVLVDFYINNANPALDFLEVEFAFDDTLLSFDSFSVTNDVFLNTYFDDAFDDFGFFIIQIGFEFDWSDFLGTSFLLGQAAFTALDDSVGADLLLTDVFAQDEFFNDISATSVSVPALFGLIFLSFATVFARSRTSR